MDIDRLVAFAVRQEEIMAERAAYVRRHYSETDLEAAAKHELATVPELKCISLREFIDEVLHPGSFSNFC